MKRYVFALSLCALAPTLAFAAAKDEARVTLGVPAYVYHTDERSSARQWNDGWFNNEGVLVDATWPVWKIDSNTNVRLGGTAGGFDNSEHKASFFLGGVAEIEHFATEKWALSVGSYIGALTGYEDNPIPAAAPYIGTSYQVTEDVEIGARGFWLPGKSFADADSDAFIAAFTIGTRF